MTACQLRKPKHKPIFDFKFAGLAHSPSSVCVFVFVCVCVCVCVRVPGLVNQVTPPGLKMFRGLVNDCVMDILYYFSPVYGPEVSM